MRSETTTIWEKTEGLGAFHVIPTMKHSWSSPRALLHHEERTCCARPEPGHGGTQRRCDRARLLCGLRGPHSLHPALVPVQDARHLLQGPKTQAQIQQIQAIDKGASRAAQGPRLQRFVLGPAPMPGCEGRHTRVEYGLLTRASAACSPVNDAPPYPYVHTPQTRAQHTTRHAWSLATPSRVGLFTEGCSDALNTRH
jgi:hypothetical protein